MYEYRLIGKFTQDHKTFVAVHLPQLKQSYVFDMALVRRIKRADGKRVLEVKSEEVKRALDAGHIQQVYEVEILRETEKATQVEFKNGNREWFPSWALTIAQFKTGAVIKINPRFTRRQAA